MDAPKYSISPTHFTKLRYSPVDAANMQFDRGALMKELRALILSRRPDFKLLYGHMSNGLTKETMLKMTMGIKDTANMNQRFLQNDFTLVYEFMNTKINEPMVYIWSPVFFSSKSLNTMAYYAYHGHTGEFMDDFYKNNIFFPKKVLIAYIVEQKGLSITKSKVLHDSRTLRPIIESDSKYWKDPNNSEKVVCAIEELCVIYNPDKR